MTSADPTTPVSRSVRPEATGSIAYVGEDHALESVPLDVRKSGWRLSVSTMGLASGLAIFATGGFATVLAGVRWGLIAGVGVTVLGALLGVAVGRVSFREGVSSTVTSRFYGFGVRGSVISALVFAFMILGFLALENALLYQGTLLMFGWQDTVVTKIGVYGVMTVFWILLAIWGIKIALRSAAIMLIATVGLSLYIIVHQFTSGVSISAWAHFGGVVPGGGWDKFQAAFGLMGGTAGTIALVTADFARYARQRSDVTVLAVAGPVVQNIVVCILGSLIMFAGTPAVASFLMAHNHSLTQGQAAATASGFGLTNTGAYFVVLAGTAGFLTIYAAQAKAQALNAYSGSLALCNLVDAAIRRRPGRMVMVVVGNAIALIMVAAGLLNHFASWISYLGVLTMTVCGIMIADAMIVRRNSRRTTDSVEEINWAGVTTAVVASVVGIAVIDSGVMPLGFLLSLAITLVLYPVLRMSILPEGRFTSKVAATQALQDE